MIFDFTSDVKNKGSQVWTISQDATVLEALKLLAEKQIGSLVVVDGKKVVGIFSERDHARKGVIIGKQPEVTKIADVMTKDLFTVNPNQSVNECMALMTERHIRHLPVFEGDQLVGLISIGDIVKDMIEELEFMVNQLEKYITGFRGSP